MKDIPAFATENGVASLVLREIPYTASGYVHIQSTQTPEAFLKECVDFCRACDAEAVYGTGHCVVEAYPLSSSLVEMCCVIDFLGETVARVCPVSQENIALWRKIYNERMAGVPNAAYMDQAGERELLEGGEGYFVYSSNVLLGIGRVKGSVLEAIASVRTGSGADVVKALSQCVSGDQVSLVVARENQRAVRLYERLGFTVTREISKWYKII